MNSYFVEEICYGNEQKLINTSYCGFTGCFIFFSYSRNPSYGKSGEVEQDLLTQRNDLRVNEWFCCVAKEQVGRKEALFVFRAQTHLFFSYFSKVLRLF